MNPDAHHFKNHGMVRYGLPAIVTLVFFISFTMMIAMLTRYDDPVLWVITIVFPIVYPCLIYFFAYRTIIEVIIQKNTIIFIDPIRRRHSFKISQIHMIEKYPLHCLIYVKPNLFYSLNNSFPESGRLLQHLKKLNPNLKLIKAYSWLKDLHGE